MKKSAQSVRIAQKATSHPEINGRQLRKMTVPSKQLALSAKIAGNIRAYAQMDDRETELAVATIKSLIAQA
jgi:hypothetical protein